jgi:putative redox protein
MKPIVVSHDSGLRFAADIRSHRLILDQPLHAGGEDAGPTPLELLGASLGSCIALYVYRFLVARNLSVAGLRVEVTPHQVSSPNRIAQFDAHIILSSEIPGVYRPMLEAVAHVCPAHTTLGQGAGVSVDFEFSAGATEPAFAD